MPVEEQIELLQLYGETVKKIHEIDLPMWWEKDENFAYMKCSPTLVRCLPESITPLIDRFDGERVGGDDDACCILEGCSFHRACFADNSSDCFIGEIDEGIRQLHDGKKIPPDVSQSLSRLFEKHDKLIAQELGKRNLCHGDYHFGNVMVEREAESSIWQVSGLIDLDLAQVTTPIEDFCKAEIYDFPDIEIPHFRRYILDGYNHSIEQFDYALLMLGVCLSSLDDHKRIVPVIQNASKIDDRLHFLGYF